MSITVSHLLSEYTSSVDLFMHDSHSHTFRVENYKIPSESEFAELQRSLQNLSSSWNSKHTEIRKKISEILAEYSKLHEEVESAYKQCQKTKDDLNATIQEQLSDGSPFFSTFATMIESHVEKIEGSVEGIRTVAQKNEETVQHLDKFSSQFYAKCEQLENEISTSISSIKLEAGTGISLMKKELSNGKVSLEADVKRVTEAGKACLADFIKEEQLSLNEKLRKITNSSELISKKTDEFLQNSHDILKKAAEYTAKFSAAKTFLVDFEPKLQAASNRQIQIEEQMQQDAAKFEQQKNEKIKKCIELEERIHNAEEKLAAVLSAQTTFQNSTLSFFQRLKWLLTGRI